MYHISTREISLLISPSLQTLLCLPFVVAFFGYLDGDKETMILMLKLLIFPTLFLVIPEIILFRRYFEINKDTRIELTPARKYKVTDKIYTWNFSAEDVKSISVFQPAAITYGGVRLFPCANYCFGRIELKSSEESLIVTSLLDFDLVWLKSISPEKISIKHRFFCSPN